MSWKTWVTNELLTSSALNENFEIVKDKTDLLPVPQSGDAAKYLVVNDDENGYSMTKTTYLISDYHQIKNIGEVGQKKMGRNYTLAELENRFGASNVKAYYRFGSGAMTTDAKGSYNLTVTGTAPVNTNGIEGTNFAASFNGGAYTQSTLLSDCTTNYNGANKGVVVGFWFNITDSYGTSCSLFNKRVSVNSEFLISYNGSLKIINFKEPNVLYNSYNRCVPAYINNQGWSFILIEHNTTNGFTLSINGTIVYTNSSNTTMLANSTAELFYIGGGVAGFYNGAISNFFVLNKVLTQKDRDWLCGVSYNLPITLQNKEILIDSFFKDSLSSNMSKTYSNVVEIENDRIILNNFNLNQSDYLKIKGSTL